MFFGKWVNDIHVVDYDAVAMLHVSATQEQQQIIDAQQKEIDLLKNQLQITENDLEKRLEKLEALLISTANDQSKIYDTKQSISTNHATKK